MKRKLLVILILSIILILIFMTQVCYAASDLGLGDLGSYKGSNPDASSLNDKAANVFGSIQLVGTILSVVMLMGIGIKYMLGSIEERAEYKETLKPYLIGCFLLFTGTLVPQIIYKFAQNL